MRRFFHPTVRSAFLLLLAGGTFSPAPASAQVTRADSAAVILRVGQDFQRDGRWAVAEALYQHILERFGDTPAALQAQAALEDVPPEGPSQSSRVELMVWATTFGAWMGVAIPGAFGADEAGAYGAGLLVGAPAGFLGARAYSRSRPLSAGQVRAITFGSLWGTWQGYGLMELLGLGEKEHCDLDFCYIEDADGETVMKALVLGGLAGTVGGALLSRRPIPRGVATATSFGGLWGTWFGLAGGILADLEGDELLASTLITGNAGLVGTALLSPGWEISRNRARLISIAGVIGGLAGAGLDLIIQPDSENAAIGIPLALSIGGLVAGARLTSDMDRPGGDPGAAALSRQAESEMISPALLRFRDGQFSLGVPTPFPTLMPVEGLKGVSFKPALGLTLLDSRF
jgi:hypothetical protein